MLLLTTTELKNLSKAVKKRFSFSNISNLLNPIIKDESFKETLKRIIGKKGNETVKNNVANEFVADLLGYENFNTALHTAQKQEKMSKYEIIEKLNKLTNAIENPDESFLEKHSRNCCQENLDNFKKENYDYLLELIEEIKSEKEVCTKAFNSIYRLLNSKIKTVEIQSCNDDNPDYFEVRFIMELSNGDKITLDMDIITEMGQINWIDEERSLINGISISDADYNEFLSKFYIEFAEGIFETNVTPEKNKLSINDEQMKKISLFLSQL